LKKRTSVDGLFVKEKKRDREKEENDWRNFRR